MINVHLDNIPGSVIKIDDIKVVTTFNYIAKLYLQNILFDAQRIFITQQLLLL